MFTRKRNSWSDSAATTEVSHRQATKQRKACTDQSLHVLEYEVIRWFCPRWQNHIIHSFCEILQSTEIELCIRHTHTQCHHMATSFKKHSRCHEQNNIFVSHSGCASKTMFFSSLFHSPQQITLYPYHGVLLVVLFLLSTRRKDIRHFSCGVIEIFSEKENILGMPMTRCSLRNVCRLWSIAIHTKRKPTRDQLDRPKKKLTVWVDKKFRKIEKLGNKFFDVVWVIHQALPHCRNRVKLSISDIKPTMQQCTDKFASKYKLLTMC